VPHDPDAEVALVGACLYAADRAVPLAAGLVAPEDFYVPAHGNIYAAVIDLHGGGAHVDTGSVVERLAEQHLLDSVGGAARVLELMSAGAAPSSVPGFAAVVRGHAQRRRLLGIAAEIRRAVLEDDYPAPWLLRPRSTSCPRSDVADWWCRT
jgi:replicative DNA helicase